MLNPATQSSGATFVAITSIDAVVPVNDFLIGTEYMLGFVAPAIESRAALLRRRLRIRIARNVDCLAAQIHAGRQWMNVLVVERALVTHQIIPC